MKFNQYTWNLYKQSSDGQKAIKEFEEASENLSKFDLMFKYNPRLKLGMIIKKDVLSSKISWKVCGVTILVNFLMNPHLKH